jgi:hypothetical protein
MKKVYINLFLIGIYTLILSCSGKLQTYDLNEEYATTIHYKGTDDEEKSEDEDVKTDLVGVPALSYYGGDLKRGAIWWAGKGIILEKGPVFLIEAINVGPDNTPFGATFPPLDLSKEGLMVKVTARAEADSAAPATPVLYMQVDDADGYQSNAKRPSNTIENSTEFKDYYFDLKDIFVQNEPKKHKVNAAMINSLKFFINPGQTAYSGKIYIKEIKIVPAKAQ